MIVSEGNCLVLEIEQEKDRLRMCIFLKEDAPTVRHYAHVSVSLSEVNRLHRMMIILLNKVDRNGELDEYSVEELKKACLMLYDQLLDKTVKERLRNASEKNLVLYLDEAIAYLPWELLYDGNDFLCLKFNLGRGMRIKDIAVEPNYKNLSSVPKMLILANPEDNLPSAAKEAYDIKDALDKMRELIHVDFKITNINPDYVKKNIRDYDILHYAGHAEYYLDNPEESGWILDEGKLKVKDILKIGESGSLPVLVFANACETASIDVIEPESEKEIYGMVRSFLISGVRHYIASICKIPDEAARFFAREFYTRLMQNKTIGEAIRLARLGLIKEYGQNQISWMAYLLFGEPMFKLSKYPVSLPAEKRSYKMLAMKLSLVLFIFILGTGLALKFLPAKRSQIDIFYEQGKNQQLMALCKDILSKDVDNLEALVRTGDVFERLGKRDKSLEYYFRYAQASERKKDAQQIASAMVKIAWGYYLKGDYPKALIFYDRAIDLAKKTNNKLVEAIALRKLAVWHMDKEEFESALELLLKSSEINRQNFKIYEHRYNLACDYFDLGLVFTDKNDFKTAKELYNKSLQIFKALSAQSELSDYYSNMGELCQLNKEYHKAQEFYSLSLNMDKKLGNLPSEAATYNMIGELYLEMKDYIKAEENFNNSLNIHQAIEDPVGLAGILYNLGLLYKEKGKNQIALDYLVKAQGIYKNIATPDYQTITQEIRGLTNK